MNKFRSISVSLLILSGGLQASDPIKLIWGTTPNHVTNSPPADFVLITSSADLNAPLTNWGLVAQLRGYFPISAPQTDASFTFWAAVSNEWRAVYVLTNSGKFSTNRVNIVSNLTIGPVDHPQFFICQYSNSGGLVSPFSNPVGFYSNPPTWLGIEGR